MKETKTWCDFCGERIIPTFTKFCHEIRMFFRFSSKEKSYQGRGLELCNNCSTDFMIYINNKLYRRTIMDEQVEAAYSEKAKIE